MTTDTPDIEQFYHRPSAARQLLVLESTLSAVLRTLVILRQEVAAPPQELSPAEASAWQEGATYAIAKIMRAI